VSGEEELPGTLSGDASASPVELHLPEVGRLERFAVRASHVGFVIWGLFLLAIYFIPAVWEPSVAVTDVLLWPVIAAFGAWWGVVLLALVTAFGTMACQWLCTDVVRLREVRRRLFVIADAFQKTVRDSPEEEVLARIIRAGEWRIARAAFVPLGLLFGPVLMSFMWIPQRVDPHHVNPAPGQPLHLQAALDGEYAGPLALRLIGGTLPGGFTDTVATVASVRDSLDELRRELVQARDGLPQTLAVRDHLAATGKTPAEALQALETTLAGKLPPHMVQWSVSTVPGPPAQVSATLEAGESGADGRAAISLPTGNAQPVPLGQLQEKDHLVLVRPGSGVVKDLGVSFTDPRPAHTRTLWRPFAALGWAWDAGWLWLYLAAYIPAMFLFIKLFRLP
jgi:uncharacterized membrane protein (DUF106 family)